MLLLGAIEAFLQYVFGFMTVYSEEISDKKLSVNFSIVLAIISKLKKSWSFLHLLVSTFTYSLLLGCNVIFLLTLALINSSEDLSMMT